MDPYGLSASELPPELIAKLVGSQGQKAIAEAMLRQSMQPLEAQQAKGRFQGVVSPLEAIAKVIQGGVARSDINSADRDAGDIARQADMGRKQAMGEYQAMAQGAPGVTPLTPNDDEGNPMPSTPAVPGDRRKAIVNALSSPYLKNSPFIKMEMDDLNKDDARADQQRFLAEQKRQQMDQRQWEIQQQHAAKLDQIKTAEAERRISREEADRRTADLRRELAAQSESLRRELAAGKAPEPLVAVEGPDGKPVLMPRSQAVGKRPAARGGMGMSATAQKELFQTDEEIQGGKAAIQALNQAVEINDKAMGFKGAGYVAGAASLLPGGVRPASVDATMDLDNILTSSAVPQLKAIFGGNPTEGERKVLLELQGSSSVPAPVRKKIFDRAIAAAQKRLEFSQKKSESLRKGTYFGDEGASTTPDVFSAADAIVGR